jgi:heat shock protein HtpX
MKNFLKAILLLTALTFFLVLCGHEWGGRKGMTAAFILACLADLGLYGFSDKIVLAMHRAQPLAENEAPEVFEILKKLSEKAGIPAPCLYILPSSSANAFSTGRGPKHASIAITHGIVGLLNREELSGVLGHELSHILDRGALFSSILAVLAGAPPRIASAFRGSFFWGGERDLHGSGHPLALILTSIFLSLAVALIRLTVFRSREYKADKLGAGLCGEPLYLASALRKIEMSSQRFRLRDASPPTAHLFTVNPLSEKGWPALFSTHPSLEDRMARLEALSNAIR